MWAFGEGKNASDLGRFANDPRRQTFAPLPDTGPDFPTPSVPVRPQALIEMFLSKDASDFAKHLPEDARRALIHKGEAPETSIVLRISTVGRQMVAQSEHIETFDVGPNLLVSVQSGGQGRVEVAVERDSLIGEEDEIELSVHVYRDGQPESLPVVPRLIFTLKLEKEIWRLSEITLAAHVPLTDPDYLQGLRKEQDAANESAAQMRSTVLTAAETSFATKHPHLGYTCTLSNLFTRDPAGDVAGEAGESGGYFDPGQSNEESNGYRFALTGCDGNPASKYRLTAAPIDSDSGLKTFCSDESGTLRFLTGGKSSTCFSRGQVLDPGSAITGGQD
jgi:hypothetical protein